MAQEDLKLKVALEDKASNGLKTLGDNVKRFADEFKNATPKVEGTLASLLRFSTGVAVGNLATLAARKVLREIGQQFRETMAASNEYANAMIGLSSIAAAFGASQEDARQAAQSLAADGLLTVTDAAEGLKNLLASEFRFSLEQSIDIMDGLKDSAAFNRQGTLEYGQAIVGATQGIKNMNSIMVDNAGVTTNLSVITRRAGIELKDVGTATQDTAKQQKLFNELMREFAMFGGDVERVLETLQGSESALRVQIFNLRSAIGFALTPAVKILIDGLMELMRTTNEGVLPAMEKLAKAGIWVAGTIRGMAVIIGRSMQALWNTFRAQADNLGLMLLGPIGSIISGIKEIPKVWDAASEDFQDIALDMGESLVKLEEEGFMAFGNIFKEAIDRTTNAVDEAAKKISDALEKEHRNFQRAVERQAKQFEESLRDLVISHREKAEELGEQIKEETAYFNENMKDRSDRFSKSMDDIEDRHREKVEKIKDQIKDERKEMALAVDEVTDEYKEYFMQYDIAAQDRLNSLKVQLDREVAKGRHADQQKIRNLESMLLEEKKALDEQRGFKADERDLEIKEVIDKHQEKLDDLQEKLDKELVEVKETREEKTEEYAKETAKARSEHAKKLLSLQEGLDLEKEIQKRHSEDFAKFQDAVREDDVARLKRKFAEEKQLLEQQHRDRLNDIVRRSREERESREAEAVRTNQALQNTYNRQAQQTSQAAKKASANVQQSLQPNFTTIGVGTVAPAAQPTAPSLIGNIASSVSNFVSRAFSSVKGFFGFQHGGIVTKPTLGLVGEAGPEVVLPLKDPERMRALMTKAGISKGVSIGNMPVTIISNEIDIDMLLERIDFMSNKEGLV